MSFEIGFVKLCQSTATDGPPEAEPETLRVARTSWATASACTNTCLAKAMDDATALKDAVALKDEAAALYLERSYADAAARYRAALGHLSPAATASAEHQAMRATLLSNEAACLLALDRYEDALAVCSEAFRDVPVAAAAGGRGGSGGGAGGGTGRSGGGGTGGGSAAAGHASGGDMPESIRIKLSRRWRSSLRGVGRSRDALRDACAEIRGVAADDGFHTATQGKASRVLRREIDELHADVYGPFRGVVHAVSGSICNETNMQGGDFPWGMGVKHVRVGDEVWHWGGQMKGTGTDMETSPEDMMEMMSFHRGEIDMETKYGRALYAKMLERTSGKSCDPSQVGREKGRDRR